MMLFDGSGSCNASGNCSGSSDEEMPADDSTMATPAEGAEMPADDSAMATPADGGDDMAA